MNMPSVVMTFNRSAGFIFLALSEFLRKGYQPSFMDLQLATGYTNPTVANAIQQLEEAEAIEVQRNHGQKNQYRILLEEV